ncbi:MAG: HD domain-containing protein [Lachnospiraceae bacterium]|nr:HD domain-containing protein [Lachnospiraceae bacterium]
MDAKQVFLDYADRYDRTNSKVELKIIHTLAVADVMKRLTDELKLTERQAYLAHLCAMFHDIGRFEQVMRYNTFLDHLSVNHAELGCEVLQQEKILGELTPKEQQMVLTAISNHNRFQIEKGLDEETLLLCKLIRDADKCDIFRVFACEDMVDTMGETESQVAQETISDVMMQSIREHRCVKKEERRTGLDIWVSFLAFFFDLYFPESVRLLAEKKYYRQPFDRVTFTNPGTAQRVEQVLDEVEKYIENVLKK